MNSGEKYQKRIRIDETRFREFLYSSNLETRKHAIGSLWGLISEIGGLPPFISIPEVHVFLRGNDMETRGKVFGMLKYLMKEPGSNLPPFISTPEFVELMVDSIIMAYSKDDSRSFKLRIQVVQTLAQYLVHVPDTRPLISTFREMMEQDIDTGRKATILRLSEWYLSERKGRVSKELLSILKIALTSPEFKSDEKILALDMVDQLIEQDVDVRKLKKALKENAEGVFSEVTTKAQQSYIEAYRRGFNKPPNWFKRKIFQFKRWKRGKRTTIPAPPPEKLRGKCG